MDFYLNETYLIERTSDRVFHFTSVEAMLKILGTNTIYFQSSLASTSDNKDRKRLFYFSLSRNKDTNFGFNSGAMSNPTQCFVRIEFDGDALNRRYRIKPIDYWRQKSYAARNDDYGNSLYGKGWNKGRSRHSFFEYEDRIMTNDSEMYPAMKYIRRIDVYVAPNNVPDNISDLATSKTFFYDNINEFNRQSDKVIENIYDYITSNESTFTPKQTRYGRSDKEIVSGARRFGQLLYGALNMPIPEIAKLFSKYRLEKYLNVFEIKRDIVRQGSIDKYTLSDISSGLSSNMHNISRNPDDVSQRFNKMVSDTLRNRGIGSWNELSREVFKSEEDDIDYTNLDIPIRCLKVGSKYVLEPDKVSVWKYFPYDDKKTLIDNLYTDITNDYGGSGERHSSKDDEHFYKYLQHKLKNDFTVADFVKLIKKFNIVGMYISEPSEIEWVTMSVNDLWFKYDYKIVDFEGDDIKFSDRLRKLLSIAKKQQESKNESVVRDIFREAVERVLLIEAMDLDQIHQNYYSDMSDEEFWNIVQADPTYDNSQPQKKGDYAQWLLNLRKGNKLDMNELPNAKKYIETYDKFKNRIGAINFNNKFTVADLGEKVQYYIDNPDEATSKSDEVRRIKEGAERVYEDERWLVIVPHTKEAAIYYGKGTTWCTAATESENYFDYYDGISPLYINIDKQTGKKYQFFFGGVETVYNDDEDDDDELDVEEEMVDPEFNDENNSSIIGTNIGLTDNLKKFYIGLQGFNAVDLFNDINEFMYCCKGTDIDIAKAIENGRLPQTLKYKINGQFIIPNGTKVIGSEAFADCGKLTSVIIPDSVTTIGFHAFFNTGLTSITIPDSVTNFGWGAFGNCGHLTSIELPNSITKIEGGLFYGCANLKNIKIPNSVEKICRGSFGGCKSLNSLFIPRSIINIEEASFTSNGLVSIVVEEGNPRYDSRNNCNAIIETETNTLIFGCKNTAIPNSVTKIGPHAFSNCSVITSMNIPTSVTTIGDSAFHGCIDLVSVDIPNSVSIIGDAAFMDCRNLKSITIPNSVVEIGSQVFSYCEKLGSVFIPDSVTSFGSHIFDNCASLESVNIPPSMTRIEHSTFHNCASLKSIKIPDTVESIGDWAFWGCSSLNTIVVPNSVKRFGMLSFGGNVNLTLYLSNKEQYDAFRYSNLNVKLINANENRQRNKRLFENNGGTKTLYHSTSFDGIDSMIWDDMVMSARRGGQHGETFGVNWFATSREQTNGKPVIIAIDVPEELLCNSARKGCFCYMNDHHIVANDDEVDLKQYNPRIVKFGAITEEVLERLIDKYGDDTGEIMFAINRINDRYIDIFGDVATLCDDSEDTVFDYLLKSLI